MLFGGQIEHVIVAQMIRTGNDARGQSQGTNIFDGSRFEFGLPCLEIRPQQIGHFRRDIVKLLKDDVGLWLFLWWLVIGELVEFRHGGREHIL